MEDRNMKTKAPMSITLIKIGIVMMLVAIALKVSAAPSIDDLPATPTQEGSAGAMNGDVLDILFLYEECPFDPFPPTPQPDQPTHIPDPTPTCRSTNTPVIVPTYTPIPTSTPYPTQQDPHHPSPSPAISPTSTNTPTPTTVSPLPTPTTISPLPMP